MRPPGAPLGAESELRAVARPLLDWGAAFLQHRRAEGVGPPAAHDSLLEAGAGNPQPLPDARGGAAGDGAAQPAAQPGDRAADGNGAHEQKLLVCCNYVTCICLRLEALLALQHGAQRPHGPAAAAAGRASPVHAAAAPTAALAAVAAAAAGGVSTAPAAVAAGAAAGPAKSGGAPLLHPLAACTACGATASGEGGAAVRLRRCGGCGGPAYCSTACQARDWRKGGHRRVCGARAAACTVTRPCGGGGGAGGGGSGGSGGTGGD